MYEYSAVIVCFFVLILLSFFKFNRFFYCLSVIYPFIVLSIDGGFITELLDANRIMLLAKQGQLSEIALAFTVLTIAANCYAIGNGQKWSIIFGGFYYASALGCLYANDLLIFFVFLEFMMIAACALFCTEGTKTSLIAAKQYFITHLASGSLMLIAINYMMAQGQDTHIATLTHLIQTNDLPTIFLLVACLINVAAVPFSFWMVNCYSRANGTNFIYLTCFTTKISMIILIKLFHGLVILKYLGLIMILYGGLYAIVENNLKRLFCYLNILQLGVLLALASIYSVDSSELYKIIAIHVLYNGLLAVILVYLSDNAKIFNCSDLKHINQPIFTISFIIAILMCINFPFTANFIHKFALSPTITDKAVYYMITLSNLLLVVALPIRSYFTHSEISKIRLQKAHILSMVIFLIVLIGLNLQIIQNSWQSIRSSSEFINATLWQMVIIIAGLMLARFLPIRFRLIDTRSVFRRVWYNIHKSCIQKYPEDSETLNISILLSDCLRKIELLHNQQTAIILVFSLLTAMIFALVVS